MQKKMAKNYENLTLRGSTVTQKPKGTIFDLETIVQPHWGYNAPSDLFHSRHSPEAASCYQPSSLTKDAPGGKRNL